ncbi:nuclear transport factor 2 family protein [Piscinibacter defluvii]|uniref:nuclear transport factor 2 family protein n=1 Tax=Piscinibacter defluvii TaxID=1796922 RepID=UPI000FDF2065|nr:nuclear transport factor 2 family protein [Piscinibacter defluvii]
MHEPPATLTRRHLLLLALPAACSRDDPQAALEATVQRLQDALEARDSAAVLALLDRGAVVQGEPGREWARRTMTLVFLRYPNVRIVAPVRRSTVDPTAPHLGLTEAQVLLVGAQGLLPERVEPYAVRLRWQREDGQWRLLGLEWS